MAFGKKDKDADTETKAPTAKASKQIEGLSLHETENAVQIAGKFGRGGNEAPAANVLGRACGFRDLTKSQASAAMTEAKRRSPDFIHEEITAQAVWPAKGDAA